MSYTILEDGRAIRCEHCQKTSWNQGDVDNLYCGHCKLFHTRRIQMRLCYTLDADHRPVPCSDPLEWGEWMERTGNRVALDQIGNCLVSTIFLGMDLGFGIRRAQFFETAVFLEHGLLDVAGRYATWDEALAGHARIRALCERAHAEGQTLTQDMLSE